MVTPSLQRGLCLTVRPSEKAYSQWSAGPSPEENPHSSFSDSKDLKLVLFKKKCLKTGAKEIVGSSFMSSMN